MVKKEEERNQKKKVLHDYLKRVPIISEFLDT